MGLCPAHRSKAWKRSLQLYRGPAANKSSYQAQSLPYASNRTDTRQNLSRKNLVQHRLHTWVLAITTRWRLAGNQIIISSIPCLYFGASSSWSWELRNLPSGPLCKRTSTISIFSYIYIDDLLEYTKKPSELLNKPRETFSLFQGKGLEIKPESGIPWQRNSNSMG